MMKKWMFLLFFSALGYSALAQHYISKISKYTSKDGLSSNEVHAIHKDSRGFMWIGTQYGLNRFDGQEFKIYTKENGSGLDFNSINKIIEDEGGNLWLVKTNEKYEHLYTAVEINLLNIYSGKTGSLEASLSLQLPFALKDISFIDQLTDQSILIHCANTKQAFSYRFTTGFQRIPFPKDINHVHSVLLKENGNMLLVGFNGAYIHKYFEIAPNGKIIHEANPSFSWTIYDKEQSYHLSTWGHLNLDAIYYFSPKLDPSPTSLFVTDSTILQTNYNPSEQLFWLKKKGRLFVVKSNGQIVYQQENHCEEFSEMPILFDGSKTWFSDRKNGLNVLTLESNHFENYQFFENPIDNSMRGIIKDKRGTLWFSTINEIGRMDKNRKPSIINSKRGFSPFLEDKKGNIWYLSPNINQNSIVRYDIVNQQTSHFPIKVNEFIWSFFEADNGEIWISSGVGGFDALNQETGEFFQKATFPRNEKQGFKIYHFQKRDEQSVWICSNQGLFIIDWDGNILANFTDTKTDSFYLLAKDIHHLHQGKDGRIWIATGDAGLFETKILHPQPNRQAGELIIEKQYTTANGLSSNALHAVYADDYGYLWISSDHGLMQLDKQNGQITKYFQSNGLPHDEFNRIAHYQGDDGKLYFGGLHGLTVFDPKHFSNIRDKKQAPVLAIANYQQFSAEKKVFEDLTTSLQENHQITLQSNDRFFNLKLALLDYKDGKNSTYHYRIKGLYDWQSTSNNELSINSMPYGKHILEIKAQNGNLQNAANTLVIKVNVLRPFYLQWWFIGLSLLAIGLGIWIYFRKRTQQLLVQQEASQLRSLDKMKSHFFANISHELRTPLTLIGLPLEHLLNNLDQFTKIEIRQYLQAAYSNKEDLNRLVNEILDLSKLEAGKLTLDITVLALRHFLERTVNIFHTSAKTKGIDFQFSNTIPEHLLLRIDKVKLEQVINNLLSNALKFTPEGGKIVVNAEWKNSHQLHIEVQDNGRGIPSDDLPHVFERYFQSHQKNVKLEGGSGIGLAICKEFVELMGGSIQVDSSLGEGSIFRFQLPLEIATETTLAPAEAEKGSSNQQAGHTPTLITKNISTPFSKEKQTVLIVEDHPELRRHLQDILSPTYNILMAENGLQALQLLGKSLKPDSPELLPHLILSDVMMPKMDGFTFLEKVKAQDKFCGIPFILLTARADIEDRLQGLRIGVDAYLTKPFEIEELILRIKNLLANAQNRQDLEIIPALQPQQQESQAPSSNTSTYQPTKEDIEWLQQVESIALQEIQNNQFGMEGLAKALLIGHRSMHRRIKQITGLTPNRYIRSIRLHQAKKLLETQQAKTLKEVAFAVGFNGLTHFSKLFETEFGKRPQQYLKPKEA